MKLRGFRTVLALFTTLSFVTYFTLWNYSEHKTLYTFKVKVPLLAKHYESPEGSYWRTRKWLFPQTEIPDPIPKGIPNDDSLFLVSLEKDKKIKLNSLIVGEMTNTQPLTNKLKNIFEYRQRNKIWEENTESAVRAVAIKVPLSAKYGELLKIVDAVKESGADPIVLQIDELPY